MTLRESEIESIPDLRLGLMRLSRRLRQERPDDALTPSQVAVLATLVQQGPSTPGQIAESERIKPPSVTRILASLEAEDLITRAPHPKDGRQVIITLTERAESRIEASREAKNVWLRSQLEQLPEQERQLVLAVAPLLNRLAMAD